MKEFVRHPIYGEIVYNESFWTGKKTLTINGVYAQPVSKKEFTAEGRKFVIIGNSFMGVKIHIDNDIVEVSPKPRDRAKFCVKVNKYFQSEETQRKSKTERKYFYYGKGTERIIERICKQSEIHKYNRDHE